MSPAKFAVSTGSIEDQSMEVSASPWSASSA
jgi:hypothetical protein